MKHILPLIVAACVTPCIAADAWIHDDMVAAQKQAAEQNKGILIEFTGSDWCGPCKMMKAKVLNKQEFADEATKHFVLLELDYPNAPQPNEVKKANAALLEKYGVRGFPTVIFADAAGNPYGGFSAARNMDFVKETMAGALKLRDAVSAAKAKAANAKTPEEQLAALVELMALYPQQYVANFYEEEKAQIIKLDTADKYGYAAAAAKRDRVAKEDAAIKAFHKEALKLKDNPPLMLQTIRNYPEREKLLPVNQQTLYMLEADFALHLEGDVDVALDALTKLVAIDPNSKLGKRGAMMKDYLEKNAEAIKKQALEYKKNRNK